MASPNIYLPVNLQQIADLVNQLPKKQKQQLVNLLLEEDITITEEQKQIVRNRIKKYKASPAKLVSEANAWKMINA
ncbi:MAG TPA: hypothetical protein VGM41_10335 [Chitinophagaceae bacterium]|jgi:hypothetical protein